MEGSEVMEWFDDDYDLQSLVVTCGNERDECHHVLKLMTFLLTFADTCSNISLTILASSYMLYLQWPNQTRHFAMQNSVSLSSATLAMVKMPRVKDWCLKEEANEGQNA